MKTALTEYARNHSVRRKLLDEVACEMAEQDVKWGEQNHDPFKYLSILVEEVGEVGKALCEGIKLTRKKVEFETHDDYMNYRKELVQVAAVAVAMLQCLERGKWCK